MNSQFLKKNDFVSNKNCLILVWMLLGIIVANGQQAPPDNGFLSHQDTIFITLGNKLEKFVQHKMQPKQTIYSLARFYGLYANDVFDYNIEQGDKIMSLGANVRIPIPNKAIVRYQHKDFRQEDYVPIFYQVREGETLYRIAKKYFRMPVDSLRFRNNIEGYDIQKGQKIHIGWLSTKGIPKDIQTYNRASVKTSLIFGEVFQGIDPKQLKLEKGVAFWQKNANLSGLFALHNKAPVGSRIAITNPMSGRTTFVKVIGRIPSESYRELVVLSAEAAKHIGAKDARFLVEVRYKK